MAAHMSRQHDTSSVLPELSTLHDLPLLSQLRWSEAQYAAFRAVCDELVHEHSALREELAIGCVVRLDRGFPAVVYEDGLVGGFCRAPYQKQPHQE
jgi:ribosome biogenesis GTPase